MSKPARPESRLFPDAPSAGWGVGVAIAGFLVGEVASVVAVTVAAGVGHLPLSHGQPPETPPVVIAGLVGLWIGLVGSAVLASRTWGSGHPAHDLGLSLRPWPDLPLGVAAGLGSQFVLIPLLYLPLRPLLPHLDQTLAHPAQQLTGHAHGAGFAVLALFVVVGAPVVEEVFFRGLVLRSLERRLAGLGARLAPVLAVVITAAVFGLAHGEGVVLAFGLGVFGVVLGVLAEWSGRLGPGIVAHASFNAVTVVALALVR